MQFEICGDVYHAIRQLGQGGSANVWHARRESDGRDFAVKRIRKASGTDSARNERFRQEISFGIASSHQNVVSIHAADENDHFFFCVMDLFPGTLRQVIETETDPYLLLEYARQLCDALTYVHEHGIVHRDIKPENVLVDSDARVLVLADFGIAHFKDSSVTRHDELLANRSYLAPEQMIKGNTHAVGSAADVFALGLVITELFTKQNPRGTRHTTIGDVYPFLRSLDPVMDRATMHDHQARLAAKHVRGMLLAITSHIDITIGAIVDSLDPPMDPIGVPRDEVHQLLRRAAHDVLTAKHLFEYASDDDLDNYNINYHCEIAYGVSTELFNTCIQAFIYTQCEAKFKYEAAGGAWREQDHQRVVSPLKSDLTLELESLISRFPLPPSSHWAGLPAQSLHYFRYCMDYHCEELLSTIRAAAEGTSFGTLGHDLRNAPLLWIVRGVRRYLDTSYMSLDDWLRREVDLANHLEIVWESTLPLDEERKKTGADLFESPPDSRFVDEALTSFSDRWNITIHDLGTSNFSIAFHSPESYNDFKRHAKASAELDPVFAADVTDLLRPEYEQDDIVLLTWSRRFDVAVTLAKVVGTRAITR